MSDAIAPPRVLYRAAVEHWLPSCPLSAARGRAGSDMSITWNPLSASADTIAYVRPPCPNMWTPIAPPSIENLLRLAPSSSTIEDRARGSAGSVTLIICTPSSSRAATTAYVPPSMLAIPTPAAPSSSSNVPDAASVPPSRAAATARGDVGSVRLIICTPSSSRAATTAYVPPPSPVSNVSTAAAPSSASNLLPSASSPTISNGSPSRPTDSILPPTSFATG